MFDKGLRLAPAYGTGIKQCCDLSVRLFVCLSVCSMRLAQQRCVLGLLLLQNTNRKPHSES